MDTYAAYKLLVDGTDVNKKEANTIKKKKKSITKDEKVSKIRAKNQIKCQSNNCQIPDPIVTFQELITKYQMANEFLNCFSTLDYKSPTPVQMQAIPVMLEKLNLFTIAPTGSGKTAAFLIPIIHTILQSTDTDAECDRSVCYPRAVVLSPTIELAKQTFQECLCLLKGLQLDQRKIRVSLFFKKKSINLKSEIIICTPMKLIETFNKDATVISLNRLSWLVIDESDKMFEDNLNSFSDQFQIIYDKCKESSSEFLVSMFSATQTKPVMDWVKENLCKELVFVRVGVKDAAVDTVSQELVYCYNEEAKFLEMKRMICAGKLKVPCLIFLDMAKSASYLHEFIANYGAKMSINVAVISGKLNDSARREAIDDFREGKTHFLICTNLISRGIDFKGVETVVNYDLPKHKEEYIHRIGRCGRAGQTGKSISLWTDEDVTNGLQHVLSIMKASKQPVNEELFELVKRKLKKPQNKGDKILTKLKRKYNSENGEEKTMSKDDKRRKMFAENCVVRKKFLERKKINSLDNKD